MIPTLPDSGLGRTHRLGVIGLWLLALALCAAVIARTPFVADLSAFLPASADARQRVLIDQVRSGAPARTLMLGITGGDAAQRAAASRTLAAALRDSGLFEQVSNGENDAWAEVGRWVFERRYTLSPAVTPERFQPDGLREAIDETLSLLGTPAGALIKPILETDPTGETRRIAEALIPAGAPRTQDGVWVGRSEPRAVLMASTRAPGADLDAMQRAIDRVRADFGPLAAQGLGLQLTGAPVFAVDSRAGIEREVHLLAAAGTVLMSLLLLVAFASIAALATALLPVATGIAAGIAAVGLVFGNVHGVTLGFGSTLIGEAVDYAIYYLIQARRHGGAGDGWRHWLRENWPTVRLGLLTSVCGFAALLFSGFPGLQQLGVFSIAGLLAAVATTRWLMPVLMPDGARGMGLRRQLGRAARELFAWLPRTRMLWLALGIFAVVAMVARGAIWGTELASLSPIDPAQLALDASLRADLGADDSGSLIAVRGDDAQAVLRRAEAVGARLDALVDQGVLGGYSSVARFLPSLETQARRRAALPAPGALQAALAEATADGPLPARRLQPFLAAVEQARQPADDTPEQAATGALAPLVNALLLKGEDGRWTALLPLTPADAARGIDAPQVRAALAGVDEVVMLDIGIELRRMYQRYLGEAQAQALVGAVVVLGLIGLSLRAPRRIVAVCQPLLLAVLLTMGGCAALGVPLGILHLIGLLLVVAVGSNYALFFDLLRDQPQPDDDTLASLALANLTLVLSFALLACSAIPALSAMGRVVAPGALLALLLSAAFAPKRPATPTR
ncbi:MMPL family transporter [Leptothrix discophora]|uniref:MMPL family transporter n=1 Tax=Leptothrix discophora TaxID=89 RepID=A0ABT9G8T0_LEPDI|nr:MMPL family transporter [Leptothrix discophora]MDP4302893.1 MMPL family transporter [Leptothrix discophora]